MVATGCLRRPSPLSLVALTDPCGKAPQGMKHVRTPFGRYGVPAATLSALFGRPDGPMRQSTAGHEARQDSLWSLRGACATLSAHCNRPDGPMRQSTAGHEARQDSLWSLRGAVDDLLRYCNRPDEPMRQSTAGHEARQDSFGRCGVPWTTLSTFAIVHFPLGDLNFYTEYFSLDDSFAVVSMHIPISFH